MKTPPIVSPEEWHAAREQLLVKEKELARARDALAAERRRMPWLAVDKEYCFEGPAASRAPQAEIGRLKERHGWGHIPWYTITDDFDQDFDVDEWHGTNAFIREGDRVFRTYFINNRGDEQLGNTWNYLDITALGRQETWEDSPEGYPQTPPYQWWNYHDGYDAAR
jgi:predicted dithiol-disulfide oxidoreductase (DUF899 family)